MLSVEEEVCGCSACLHWRYRCFDHCSCEKEEGDDAQVRASGMAGLWMWAAERCQPVFVCVFAMYVCVLIWYGGLWMWARERCRLVFVCVCCAVRVYVCVCVCVCVCVDLVWQLWMRARERCRLVYVCALRHVCACLRVAPRSGRWVYTHIHLYKYTHMGAHAYYADPYGKIYKHTWLPSMSG